MTPAPTAPLEASDPQRAQTLKRKVLDRITDVRRHLNALQAAMAAFGEDFDLDVFQTEFDTNARRDLDALARIGVISQERASRLQRLREYRRLFVHEYASATAAQVHEAARILADELPPFYRAYGEWVRAGFRRPTN